MPEGRSAAVFYGPRVTIHNDKIPEDVLLEIFDAYRQDMELQPRYQNVWNSSDGWFKLAHVCLHWRRVVLLSASRLHMYLLFTPRRSPRDPLLRCLPRLPILVDYSTATWTTEKEKNLALATITHRGRASVHGIALAGPCPDNLRLALTYPFPELESLEISSSPSLRPELILPAMFLSNSTPALRRLTLRSVVPSCLPPLLSSATGLVELALTLIVDQRALPEASLIGNLQLMSCLRRLELKLCYRFQVFPMTPSSPPASARDAVSLSNLTDLIFIGHRSYLQTLVCNLIAPSLQHLDAEILDMSPIYTILQHLCKFICDTGSQCIAVRLDLLSRKIKLSAGTSPNSDHAQPFKILFPVSAVPLGQFGTMLPGPLCPVEELVVVWDAAPQLTGEHHTYWRVFFNHIRRVTMVQVPFEVVRDVADSFKHGGLLDLLPALEQIKVHITHLPRIGLHKKTTRDAFKPLISARRKAGRPIMLSWV